LKKPKPLAARAEGRTRGERAWAHAEAWAERRGNGPKKVAAAGAATVIEDGAGGIGAEPVTAGFARCVDALHGETGQILHVRSLSGRPALRGHDAAVRQKLPWAAQTELSRGFCRHEPVVSREMNTMDCGGVAAGSRPLNSAELTRADGVGRD